VLEDVKEMRWQVHRGKSRCHDRQAIKVARNRFGRSEAAEQVQVTQMARLRE
jgi:hypothetical protein